LALDRVAYSLRGLEQPRGTVFVAHVEGALRVLEELLVLGD